MSIFPRYFFKSVLCVKTGEVEVNRYWKMVQKMITLTKHVIPGLDLLCAGPRHFGDFFNIFQPNISEDQKKSYYLSAGPWHWALWQIRRWILHYVHKKFRWGPEVATFTTKTLYFTLVIRLNYTFEFVGKNWIKGVRRGPWSSILFIVNYCCTRVLLYTKMLKETENEETRFFC